MFQTPHLSIHPPKLPIEMPASKTDGGGELASEPLWEVGRFEK
jgi:hypothetical protein